jgi:hypothetical protein
MKEDDDTFECDKFDDCRFCRHRFAEIICEDCDVGENFEEEDYDEVDKYFKGRI